MRPLLGGEGLLGVPDQVPSMQQTPPLGTGQSSVWTQRVTGIAADRGKGSHSAGPTPGGPSLSPQASAAELGGSCGRQRRCRRTDFSSSCGTGVPPTHASHSMGHRYAAAHVGCVPSPHGGLGLPSLTISEAVLGLAPSGEPPSSREQSGPMSSSYSVRQSDSSPATGQQGGGEGHRLA